MLTAQSPFGFFTTMNFVASLQVEPGASYWSALYAATKNDAVLVANTKALTDAVRTLNKRAGSEAVHRPVLWQTMSGERLPNDLRMLVRAIVGRGQASFEHAVFTVEWKDSVGGPTKIMLELGDYFTLLGTASPVGSARARHKERVAIAMKAIDARILELKEEDKQK